MNEEISIVVYGDKENNFDGKLKAEFENNITKERHYLYINLEKIEAETTALLMCFYSDTHMTMYRPNHQIIKFNKIYHVDKEQAAMFYYALITNLWTPEEN